MTGAVFSLTPIGPGGCALLSTLTSSFATKLIETGDFNKALNALTSKKTWRLVATNFLTAEITQALSAGLEISTTPTTFFGHLQYNALRAGVSGGLSMAILKTDLSDALLHVMTSTASGTLGGWGANQLAGLGDFLNFFEHKLAHGVLGAGMGAILSPRHPFRGVLPGFIGGALSEIIAEGTVGSLGSRTAGNLGLLGASTMALLLNQDVDIANATAGNAMVNDFYNKNKLVTKKLVAFAEKNSAELAGYNMQTAGGTPTEVKAILDNPLFQSLVDEGYDVSRSGIMTTRLPPLPGIERSKFSTPDAHHHQLLDLFLSSAEFLANLAERNPRVAQLAVAGLQSALMGPVKMIQGAVQDYFFGETIANFKEIATRFVSDKLMIHPQYVELAGSAAYMGICFAFAGATKVVNAAQEVQQSVGRGIQNSNKQSMKQIASRSQESSRKQAASQSRIKPINNRGPINAKYANKVYPLEKLPKALRQKYPHSVPFTGTGHPDFSRYAIKKVQINVSGNHKIDNRLANKAAGISKKPKGYTWHHHHDGKTMMLVDKELHNFVKHTGGVAIKKGGK